uniref:Uncharacterized protein n=1 Tax=Plectus sambesii TaxID=2011161 RepID=A0A914UVN6_9BILA
MSRADDVVGPKAPANSSETASACCEADKPDSTDSANKVVTFLAVAGTGQRPRIQRTSTPYSELIAMSSTEEESDASLGTSPAHADNVGRGPAVPLSSSSSPVAKK